MGMAASSLRFAQLTARKNQVEFEGQQINQQRLTLSQKSSAIYNDMLTRQVPTAPDPSSFTKIVYKFNNGYGTSSILNLAKKASGAYNYNVTYKRPKTTKTLSRSSFTNVGFAKTIGVTGGENNKAKYYARTANINGVGRNLSLVGSDTAAGKLADYRQKLETYKNMQTIENQLQALNSKTGVLDAQTQKNIASSLGLTLSGDGQYGSGAISKALFGDNTLQPATNGLRVANPHPEAIALGNYANVTGVDRQAAYYIAAALGAEGSDAGALSSTNRITTASLNQALFGAVGYTAASGSNPATYKMSENLRKALFDKTDDITQVSDVALYIAEADSTDDLVPTKLNDLNDLQREELANLLAQYAKEGSVDSINAKYTVSTGDYTNYENYENYGQAANSLFGVMGGLLGETDLTVTSDQMKTMLQELLSKVGGCGTSAEYKTAQVDPAFTAYQAATATPGIVNIGENQALYEYEDDNGDKCYMYVNLTNIDDDVPNTYADSVSIYENVLNYLDGEYETEQQDANVIMSEDGQVSKITFADGSVVTPEVVTEMDSDAYDQAMVEYEYKKEVYDKEMNDANAKVKIIQAQDQKLEVRLKQLDTEQKALQTEIDAVKSIRDKSIESSFKTFS